MKLKLPYLNVIAICTLSVGTFVSATNFSTGIANRTGSPGENTCVECHNSAPLNEGPGAITITSQIPATGYVPGEVYSVTVNIAQSGISVFGFDFEALTDANTNAGSLAVNSSDTKLLTVANKTNVTHTAATPVLTAGSKSYSFNWTAPTTPEKVTFYASGNAANGNRSPVGDFIYSTSVVVNPASTTAVYDADGSASAFKVFPSPGTGNITLDYNHIAGGQMSISLYNTNGKLLEELYSANTVAGTFAKNFDVSAHPAGVYFIKIKTSNKVHAKMIVLN